MLRITSEAEGKGDAAMAIVTNTPAAPRVSASRG